uniref:Wadjet protein JetD C-terminal domain-containing protein n=1 Tax=Solibacter usitatus (strain Ellin6076) TaxID=234267 RepID=Q027Z5_SOLUE
MPRICYRSVNFSAASLAVISAANAILQEYVVRAIVVTLRQLYYQFVVRDLLPNRQSEYKRLGSIINDARMAGLIDWNYLQDRTRNLARLPHWDDPGDIIHSAADSYHRDLWQSQNNYVEVWIEKDALVGVIESVCEQYDVPYFSCRGYTSQSEMWGTGQRLSRRIEQGQTVHIIHLGDHDPSGLDMSRDIKARLEIFLGRRSDSLQFHRIALHIGQVRRYSPPPNPANVTDSRAEAYMALFGSESWELDALDPDVLTDLIRDNTLAYLDLDLWEEQRRRQESEREVLTKASRKWPQVATFLKTLK